jgi:hypothetical protein
VEYPTKKEKSNTSRDLLDRKGKRVRTEIPAHLGKMV